MEKLDWVEHFKPFRMVLKMTGLWPPKDESYQLNLYTLYSIIAFLLFHLGFISCQAANLYFIMDDLKGVTAIIFVLLTDITASWKAYSIMKNMKMLKQLMSTINCDFFQPKTASQRNLIEPNIRIWKFVARFIWLCTWGCLILWSLFPVLDQTLNSYRLPFLAWFPYNTETSPQYEFTYLYQVVSISFLANANVCLDILIAYLNMYIGAQFVILCDKLRNLRQIEDTSEEINRKLIDCVHHHREILNFADHANGLYNSLLLVQLFVMAISIGLALFQLTVVAVFSSEFYSFVQYASTIVVEVFLYCWFGNEIELKSGELSSAVLESDWTDVSQEVKQNMLVFMLRAGKPLKISAFGLFNLSLENFVFILRTAYSYFALLRQVNAPK